MAGFVCRSPGLLSPLARQFSCPPLTDYCRNSLRKLILKPRCAKVAMESLRSHLSSFWPSLYQSIMHPLLPLSGLVTSVAAVNLYVSSYAGTITSLQLTQDTKGSYSLSQVAVNEDSAPNPSWLTKDEYNDVIYCVDEGLTVPNGSLASYKTSPSGELTKIDRHTVISGPVSSVVYNGGKGLALAH